MKKLFLTLIFICLIPCHAQAMPTGLLGIWGGESCDTSNIVLFYRAEDLTLNGDCVDADNPYDCCTGADAGTCDYNAGADTVWAAASGAAISDTAEKYGTYGLLIPDPGNDDYFYLDSPTATLDDEGRIGFWIYINDFTDDAYIFTMYYDNNEVTRLRMDGTDELNAVWTDPANAQEFATTDANLALTTWYFIEYAWKTSSNYQAIFVNGVRRGLSSDTIASYDNAVGVIYLGIIADVDAAYFVDNVIISTDSTVDLYTVCKDKTEWSE